MDRDSFQQSVAVAHSYVSSYSSTVSIADGWSCVLFLGQLPALRDGMTWVAGFRGIVEHLRKKSQGLVLDALLSDIEKAECTAYVLLSLLCEGLYTYRHIGLM